jgi:hypothetical protein
MKTIKCNGNGYECVCGSECNGPVDTIEAANLRSLTPTPKKTAELAALAAKWERRAAASEAKMSPENRALSQRIGRLVDRFQG